MGIGFDQISPLLKGSYRDRNAVWKVLEQVVLPILGPPLVRLWSPRVGVERADFPGLVLKTLGERIILKEGLTPPKGDPPSDYTAWLRVVLCNCARDLLRAAPTPEVPLEPDHPSPAEDPPLDAPDPEEDGLSTSPTAKVALARLRKSSPLRLLALYCRNHPALIDRPLLEACAATGRNKPGTVPGLARPVEKVLELLRHHRKELANGTKDPSALKRFAWILRSDEARFETWAEDEARVARDKNTLSKWHTHAKKFLEDFQRRVAQSPASTHKLGGQ